MEKRLLEIKKRKQELRNQINSLSGTELDNAIAELDTMEGEQKDIEKRFKACSMLNNGDIDGTELEKPVDKTEKRSFGLDSKEYRSAFYKKLSGAELNDFEKRAMTTNANSAGSAVPTQTLNKILEKIESDSIVYGLVSVSHLRGTVSLPLEGVTNDVERLAEGSDGTVKDDTLKNIVLGAKKYIKLVRLTCELEATSIDALENYIVNKLTKKLTQAFDHDIIDGTGVNSATGILKTITPIETSASDVLAYDDVCDLFAELSAAAKKNATLMMSTNTLYKRVKKIKDENKSPIFDVTSNKVLGREIVECDDVPDGVIIFGDFSEYQFNWNKDIEITKSGEAAFASGDTVFRGLALADGKLADLGAMVALKIKQSAE